MDQVANLQATVTNESRYTRVLEIDFFDGIAKHSDAPRYQGFNDHLLA